MIKVTGKYPGCAHGGCCQPALDGYCEATCCVGYIPRKAYCSEHSHRPTRVLEILGHRPTQETFTRDEVRSIVMALWIGAGMVYESAGKMEMERDLATAARAIQEAKRSMDEIQEMNGGLFGKDPHERAAVHGSRMVVDGNAVVDTTKSGISPK